VCWSDGVIPNSNSSQSSRSILVPVLSGVLAREEKNGELNLFLTRYSVQLLYVGGVITTSAVSQPGHD
jgi:hypothetical protein